MVGPLPNLAFLDSYCHDTSRIFFSAPDLTIGMPFGSHRCGILTVCFDAILSSKYLLDIELQLPNIGCLSLGSDFELGFKFSVLY